jgi:hypothetical protein
MVLASIFPLAKTSGYHRSFGSTSIRRLNHEAGKYLPRVPSYLYCVGYDRILWRPMALGSFAGSRACSPTPDSPKAALVGKVEGLLFESFARLSVLLATRHDEGSIGEGPIGFLQRRFPLTRDFHPILSWLPNHHLIRRANRAYGRERSECALPP